MRKKRTELRVHAAVDQLQLEGNRPRELVGEIRRHEPQPDGPNGRELVLRDPNLPLVELFGVDHGSGPAPVAFAETAIFSVAGGGRDVRSTDDDDEDPSSPSPGRGVGLEKRRLNATLGQHGQRDEDGQVSSSPSLYSSQQPQTEWKKVSFAHERAARPIHS